MFYYLSHWKWHTNQDGFSFWDSPVPEITTGRLDLRNSNESSLKETVSGYGVFETSVQDSAMGFYLSDSLTKTISLQIKQNIETSLNITVTSETLGDILWEVFTQHADPTGQTKWKPLMPDKYLNIELYLGEAGLVKREKFNN